MVQRIIKDGKTVFQCEACKFLYKKEALAKRCEDYCNEHNACSIEITKYAIKNN